MPTPSTLFRHLPSMDVALQHLEADPLLAALPRDLRKDAATAFLDMVRAAIKDGRINSEAQLADAVLLPQLAAFVRRAGQPHFCRVLNATGVVVHTNLGRSLLAEEAIQAVTQANRYYSNLEFDLDSGERGSRYSHVEALVCRLTGAEAALVVNNNAAAVLLMLATLCQGQEVIVSRGQLVEIGGSFRIPDVMARSGAILREVGATNRTHPRDYENAITDQTAALLKVHTSNFRIIGFTKEVGLAELREIGDRHGLPVLEDLGSGTFFDFSSIGLHGEPTVRETLAQGADVVTCSGDKVLGGPQAGLILGRKRYIDPIKKNPLNRALRIDKMTLAALEATLRLYLDPARARERIPTLRMLAMTHEELARNAARLARRLRRELGTAATVSTCPGASRVGGGAFPERDLPTTLVELQVPGLSPDELQRRLLEAEPPLVGRIERNRFCLDPRTLQHEEVPLVATVLRAAIIP
ncbi:MAG: L-seryl-tRNA(Sec) selenium transferase [Desulfovibrio sp.]|nr:L-seryl-tRNA(Sec) selenium transferase [Desulfovibrio sp.]MCA1986396.1 L-seryl-tRNA(Sec) selenium transferase [Desulfovibrio sp.]